MDKEDIGQDSSGEICEATPRHLKVDDDSELDGYCELGNRQTTKNKISIDYLESH